MNTLFKSLIDIEPIYDFLHPEGAAYLLAIFVILVAAKFIYDLSTPYKITHQLIIEDNKAVAVTFAGYMLGVGIIILSVFSTEAAIETRVDFYKDVLFTIAWGLIGIILLQIARIVTDKILLRKFDNTKELITDKNIGTGAVEFGTYVGSGLIIYAALLGEDQSFLQGLISTLIFFIMGQIGFIIFGAIYQIVSRFDLHEEIEKDNISAGVAFGMSLIAVAILLSGYIARYDSLPGFLIWLLMSLFFLVVSRYIVDKLILPGSLLDEEIRQDQNWGAALVEGGVAIGLAFLLVPSFL